MWPLGFSIKAEIKWNLSTYKMTDRRKFHCRRGGAKDLAFNPATVSELAFDF